MAKTDLTKNLKDIIEIERKFTLFVSKLVIRLVEKNSLILEMTRCIRMIFLFFEQI